jgi:heme-degrading monooxygenase HmoA
VVTVITLVTLKDGMEPEWDGIMRERMESAKGRKGWIGGQIAIPFDALNQRVIIGTWETRAEWEAWHADEEFLETREKLQGMQQEPDRTTWHEVTVDVRPER